MTKLERRRADGPPQAWSKREEETLLALLEDGVVAIKKLRAALPNRTRASINCKKRRLRIREDTFGKSYRDEKAAFTEKVASSTTPTNVFEAYAGAGHQTMKWLSGASHVFSVDRSSKKTAALKGHLLDGDFHREKGGLDGWESYARSDDQRVSIYTGDAVVAAAGVRSAGVPIDMVDLDTCGSTLPTLGLFLQLLRPRHLTITHGEFHSYRFGREDVLRRVLLHRDITRAHMCSSIHEFADELRLATCVAALRSHNETQHSYWLKLEDELWFGPRNRIQMIRRHYRVVRPSATADCLNILANELAYAPVSD